MSRKFQHGLMVLMTATVVSGLGVTPAHAAIQNHRFKIAQMTQRTTSKSAKLTKKGNGRIRLYRQQRLTSFTWSRKSRVFYATKTIKFKKTNGHTATYRYVRTKNHKYHGWIAAGNLKGKLGKTTKVNKKRLVVNVVHHKTRLKQTAKTGTVKLYHLTDNLTDAPYRGIKNIATYRQLLNQLGKLLQKQPKAFDEWGQDQGWSHAVTYRNVASIYREDLKAYENALAGHGQTKSVNSGIKYLKKWLARAN